MAVSHEAVDETKRAGKHGERSKPSLQALLTCRVLVVSPEPARAVNQGQAAFRGAAQEIPKLWKMEEALEECPWMTWCCKSFSALLQCGLHTPGNLSWQEMLQPKLAHHKP